MLRRIIRSIPIAFLMAVLLCTAPTYAKSLAKVMSADTWWEDADDLLLDQNAALRKDAEKQVKKAWKKLKKGSSERVRLALKVQLYTETGFDTDLAAQYVDEALLTTDYGYIDLSKKDADKDEGQEDSVSDQAGYPFADKTEAISYLISCRAQADLGEIFSQILETGSPRDLYLLDVMGQALQGESLETVLPYAVQAGEADWDGAYLLNLVWSPDGSPADTAKSLCAMEDETQRSLILEAAGMSFTDMDEILQYISSCAKLGTAPSACYPEGIDLSIDLSDLNADSVSRTDPDQVKLLVVSRNEKKPSPDSSLIPSNFVETNNHPDPGDCTVRLETAWMDQIPEACLPASLEEVNTLLVMDNQYYVCGTYTVENTAMVNGEVTNSSSNDYRVYAAVQINSCFDWPSQSLLYSYSGHYTAPPEVPEEDKEKTSYGISMTPDVIRKYYRADMDADWAAENMQEHMQNLSQNGWHTDLPSETGGFKDISAEDWNTIMNVLYPQQVKEEGWLNADQFSVQVKANFIELNWETFAGANVCDGYYLACWRIPGDSRYYWRAVSPGDSAVQSFEALPGYRYEIGVWYGAQTPPPAEGGLEYYATEAEVPVVSDDPAAAGLQKRGEPYFEIVHGEESEPLEGAVDPAILMQEDTGVQFCMPLVPVDGKGRDVHLMSFLTSPEGYIYSCTYDFTMVDEEETYNLFLYDLLSLAYEDQGGTITPGDWTIQTSIDGVLIGKGVFTVG